MNFNHLSFLPRQTQAACLGLPVSLAESTKYHPQRVYSYTGVRAYGHVTTKFSWMDRLPNCVSVLRAFVELRYKFTCEITKLPWQHSVNSSVSMRLTLDQNSTNMWLALNWHMDRYVGKHSVDMSTDSSHLITTWLAHMGEHSSAEGRLRTNTQRL